MNFRRLPFQFSSTDPVERVSELEKRFGLNSKKNMYVDVASPLSSMDAEGGSPRRQLRVPIFLDGYDQPINTSVDSVSSADAAKKSKVRVVPIQFESADSTKHFPRHRTHSGPSVMVKEKENALPSEEHFQPKLSSQNIFPNNFKQASGPKIHDIPIKIEKRNTSKSPVKQDRLVTSKVRDHVKSDARVASKQLSESKCDPVSKPKVESPIEMSLSKINEVLKDLVSYEAGVKEFTGTVKDKQYRYLDEMLTRCMLKLDDVDTMGDEEVRSARKSAIKKVQASVDLLETKINTPADEKYSDVPTNTEIVKVVHEDSLIETVEDSKLIPGSDDVIDREVTDSKVEILKTREIINQIKTDAVLMDNSLEMKEADAIQSGGNMQMGESTSDEPVEIVKTTEISIKNEAALTDNSLEMKDDAIQVDGNMQMSENSSEEPVDISPSQTEVLLTSSTSDNLFGREIINVATCDSKDITESTSDEPVDVTASQQTDVFSPSPKFGDLINEINITSDLNNGIKTFEIDMVDNNLQETEKDVAQMQQEREAERISRQVYDNDVDMEDVSDVNLVSSANSTTNELVTNQVSNALGTNFEIIATEL